MMSFRHAPILPFASAAGASLALLVVWLLLLPAVASADIWDGFEEAGTTWKVAEADGSVRVLAHERTWRVSRGGHASEYLRLACGAGTYAYIAYDIPPTLAIGELQMGLWLKSDRVGPQLWARVVLPRTREPRGQRPVSILIPGSSYSGDGVWEKLALENLPLLIERQARVLRAQLGTNIDTREAYVDKLVLNAYTQPGAIGLWIDDLEVTGQVTYEKQKGTDARAVTFEESIDETQGVQLDGSMVLIEGRPAQLRIIEHNGESLEWLQSLGFNTVLLKTAATPELLSEAQRISMWLIAPPAREGQDIAISRAHDPVLAWMLGNKLGPLELDTARNIARELRSVDSARGRPLIAQANSPLSAYSRCASMLFLEPPALGGSFEMADYSQWFVERTRLARPGTPLIAMLPSEPPVTTQIQVDALRPRTILPHVIDYEQLRLLTFTAIASGVRGVCYRSDTRLDGQHPTALQRADTLRLLNAELRLVEPWMAAGSPAGDVEVDDPAVRISALQTDRARLLVVRRYLPGQQWVVTPVEKDRVSLVMPGTPSAMHAYRLSVTSMEPLLHKRVTGGTHMAIESAGVCSLVVLTQDPLVLNRVARDLGQLEMQHARLYYELTARKLEIASQALAELPAGAFPAATATLQQARANLQQALRLVSAQDRRGAQKFTSQADAQLATIQRGHWQAATLAFASPVESPLCTHFATLPAHYELAERLKVAHWSDNMLAGGDMEQLDLLLQAGWRNQRDPNVAVDSAVQLAPQPRTGQSSLHMRAFVAQPNEAPSIVETPPVWVTTPAITVGRNKMVRVRGYVRTSSAIAGSQDGVMVFDSIGGQALASRIVSADGWRQFTLFRVVPEDTTLTLTLALTGIGEAWIDDLDIAVLDLPTPRERPSREPMQVDEAPEEIPAPGTRVEELPAPQARGWWPRLR